MAKRPSRSSRRSRSSRPSHGLRGSEDDHRSFAMEYSRKAASMLKKRQCRPAMLLIGRAEGHADYANLNAEGRSTLRQTKANIKRSCAVAFKKTGVLRFPSRG